jgi:uracil-DNA glycosylase
MESNSLRAIEAQSPRPSAADFLPHRLSVKALREAAAGCRGCPLFRHATQTVFGAGAVAAKMMLVGETPGDQEDIQGKPFVGPAGRLLGKLLLAAGIDRRTIYITNAVKHFKWEPRGKKRLHAKPNAREIAACRPWLEAEILAVKPRTIVCLGATAAQTLLGKSFRLTQHLGEPIDSPWAKFTFATYHPSALLRTAGEQERHRLMERVVQHLKLAASSVR